MKPDDHSRDSAKPRPDFSFAAFEITRELWNKYKLEDGTTLKMKLVLINVLVEKDFIEKVERARSEKGIAVGLTLQTKDVLGVEPPKSLIGEPATDSYTPQQLESSVVQDDLDFVTVEESWNTYKVEGSVLLRARMSPIRIRRTNKTDSQGLPVYLVDFRTEFKLSAKRQ